MGIRVYQLQGYEADDVIATMAAQHERQGGRCSVISADKDLFQLVNDRTTLLRISSFGSGDLTAYDSEAVEKRLGIRPEQVPDWLALVGDASDNIPGVPSIGEKGATALLQEYASIEDLLKNVDSVKNKRARNALTEHGEAARVSLRLATVHRDAPIAWNVDECRVPGDHLERRSPGRTASVGISVHSQRARVGSISGQSCRSPGRRNADAIPGRRLGE
jgi:DNA polymerase I